MPTDIHTSSKSLNEAIYDKITVGRIERLMQEQEERHAREKRAKEELQAAWAEAVSLFLTLAVLLMATIKSPDATCLLSWVVYFVPAVGAIIFERVVGSVERTITCVGAGISILAICAKVFDLLTPVLSSVACWISFILGVGKLYFAYQEIRRARAAYDISKGSSS